MKRCVKEHVVPAFGVIPVGSLWEDDSPYITDPKLFVNVAGHIVGEQGPELFVPDVDGFVEPNKKAGD